MATRSVRYTLLVTTKGGAFYYTVARTMRHARIRERAAHQQGHATYAMVAKFDFTLQSMGIPLDATMAQLPGVRPPSPSTPRPRTPKAGSAPGRRGTPVFAPAADPQALLLDALVKLEEALIAKV